MRDDIRELNQAIKENRWENASLALLLAQTHHRGQRRKSGEPYVAHPIRVAYMLLQFGIRDDIVIAVALLHDVLEDCPDKVSPSKLRDVHLLSERVVSAVMALTKRPGQPTREYYALLSQSAEATLVKIADRWHNLATMVGAFPLCKIQEYVHETEQYTLPLCERGKTMYPSRLGTIRAFEILICSLLALAKLSLTQQMETAL